MRKKKVWYVLVMVTSQSEAFSGNGGHERKGREVFSYG